jgi:hypothetical protein
MKSPEEPTQNGRTAPFRPAYLPPVEEVWARRDKDLTKSLEQVNKWAAEARRRGIPLHMLLAEMDAEEERRQAAKSQPQKPTE